MGERRTCGVAVAAVLGLAGCGGGGLGGSGDDAQAAADAAAMHVDQGVARDGGAIMDAGASVDLSEQADASGGGGGGDLSNGGGRLPLKLPAGLANWTFYGPESGGPNRVYGASLDEGGTLWVAGGEEGLFVLRPGAMSFQRYTMADGLRPYGYMPDGSTPIGTKYLKVISVSGAWAGTAFVGYEGKAPGGGQLGCEDNWDGPHPDPSIYKSGDADKVTLNGNAISVVHYDISSGPGLVGAELRGREKLCDIDRIRYDKVNQKVWFGGNHGFAMGEAAYSGTASCQWESSIDPPIPTMKTSPLSNEYGHAGCNGVLEHVHPAINGAGSNGKCCVFLTGGYYGVSVDPVTHDIWFGGLIRTTKFHFGAAHDYYDAEERTEASGAVANRIDVWPDKVSEPAIPLIADRVDDAVSGAAAMDDGTVWLSSFTHGLAHLDASGTVIARLGVGDGLASDKLASIVADPLDQSVWAGTNFGPGLSRLASGKFTSYGLSVLGDDLANEGVPDLQSWGSGGARKIIVSFGGDAGHAGAVGIYGGP